jgi:hypothetical protein
MGRGKKKRTARGDVTGEEGHEKQDAGEIANGWTDLGYGVTQAGGAVQTGWYLLCRSGTETGKSYEVTSKSTPYDFENHIHLYPSGEMSAKFKGNHIGDTITITGVLLWAKANHKINEDASYPMEGELMAKLVYDWSRKLYMDHSGDEYTCPRD